MNLLTETGYQRVHLLGLVILFAGWLAFPFHALASEDGPANPFVGAWELVAFEAMNEDGQWQAMPLTGDAEWVGSLLYSASGVMSAQIYTSDRQSVPYSRSLVNGYMGYFGRYEIDFEAGTVTHLRQGHINPDRNTQAAVRSFRFDGDYLYLTPLEDSRHSRLIWKRIK